MKLTILFVAMLTSLLLLSCNDDDDELKLTKKDGLPSFFEQINQTYNTQIYFSYQDNQITLFKNDDGSTSRYNYESGFPSEIISGPPTNAADGHGETRFIKETDHKIRVEGWGEPSSMLHIREIELDDNGFPVKITDLGSFDRIDGNLIQMREGAKYAKITIDPTTKNLLKREVFKLKNSELIATYSYEYENTPGTMSSIDWPLWLFIYLCDGNSTSYTSSYRQFFNYKNNLIKETAFNKEEGINCTVNYTYTYNQNGYPITATNDRYEVENKVTIRY